jgi:oligopeptide/dipeptide ABC transporter ATP-binding protein
MAAAAQIEPGAVLDIDHLRVRFPTPRGPVNAVSDVSLSLRPGEILALVGESGSGKSMTALAVMGLLGAGPDALDGRICFHGEDLLKASPARMRGLRGARISMIFQNPMSALNPVLPIGRQIGDILRRHTDLSAAQIRARVLDLLNEVGIVEAQSRMGAFPHELSGGMCQRVMIAMALACDPDLLIADEPTTALDVTVQKQIMTLVGELRDRRGAAILVITHDLGVVSEHADRVAVMYAGRIVEQGPVGSVFAAPAHPYTAGLMASMPDMDDDSPRFHAIPGSAPDLARLPPGCPFAPRCERAQARCHAGDPAPEPSGPAREARCWFPLSAVAP